MLTIFKSLQRLVAGHCQDLRIIFFDNDCEFDVLIQGFRFLCAQFGAALHYCLTEPGVGPCAKNYEDGNNFIL